MILANTIKTNKVFFNATPYASGMMTDLSNFESGTKMNISYLRSFQEVYGNENTRTYEWVPLEFKDSTKVSRQYRDSSYESNAAGDKGAYEEKSCSLVKSGFVEFDMPSDWAQVSISDLAFGIFNSGSVPVGTAANSIEVSGAWYGRDVAMNEINVGTDQIFGTTDYTEDIICVG